MKNTKLIQMIIGIIIISVLMPNYNPALSKHYRQVANQTSDKTASLSLAHINNKGDPLTVDIIVNPGETPINLVGLHLRYQNLILKDIKKESSFCSLFIKEEINNEQGELSFACGHYYPGINTEKVVVKLIFEKKNNQAATMINIDDNSIILANDGYGTNVLNNKSEVLKPRFLKID